MKIYMIKRKYVLEYRRGVIFKRRKEEYAYHNYNYYILAKCRADAIALANILLPEYKNKFPKNTKDIICSNPLSNKNYIILSNEIIAEEIECSIEQLWCKLKSDDFLSYIKEYPWKTKFNKINSILGKKG